MARKPSGRAAPVIATGIWLAVSAPAMAFAPADNEAAISEQTQKVSKPIDLSKPNPVKKLAKARGRVKLAVRSRKVATVAAKSQRRNITEAKIETKAEVTLDENAASKALPATVANARAQLLTPPGKELAPLEIAAVDQMNELDRALNETPPEVDIADRAVTPTPAATPVLSPVPAPPAVSFAQISRSTPSTPWEDSSLVGKIFIAFGGMLTLASAARMLIA